MQKESDISEKEGDIVDVKRCCMAGKKKIEVGREYDVEHPVYGKFRIRVDDEVHPVRSAVTITKGIAKISGPPYPCRGIGIYLRWNDTNLKLTLVNP